MTPPTAAHHRVRDWLGGRAPEAALVLGSGLGLVAEQLSDVRRLAYPGIPGFPSVGVAGHAGELLSGRLRGREVLCQSGRFHGYEGHGPDVVALPVRLFAALGIRTLVVTNAAGGIRRGFRPGDLVCLADQINFTFGNPLIGAVHEGESRFPDMSAPFDPALRALAHAVARAEGVALGDGVYAGVMGPSYETPAEIRMLERMGADLVGMSTVQEVVTARAAGLDCLGFSVVTNLAAGLGASALSHEEVMAVGRSAAAALARVLAGVVAGLPTLRPAAP